MNWKQKLEQFKLNENELSIRIKNKIKDYNSIVSGIEEIKGQMEAEGLSQEQADDLQENLDSLEGALTDLDESLSNDIEKYNRNKDMYAEKAKNLKHQKAKNTIVKSSENQDKSDTQEKTEETVVSDNVFTSASSATANVSGAAVVSNIVSNNEGVVVEKINGLENDKKKGISTSSLILGGVLLVLSFGAYNYFTKND